MRGAVRRWQGLRDLNVAQAAGTDPVGNPVVSAPAQAAVTVEEKPCPPEKPCKPCKPGKPGKPCKPGSHYGYGGDTHGHDGHDKPEGGTKGCHRW